MQSPLKNQSLFLQYKKERSEQGFTQMVEAHADLVYSAALRQLRDPHLAEEVTQHVFILLNKKIDQIPDRVILSGWLYKTALFLSRDLIKKETRRRLKESRLTEQELMAMNPGTDEHLDWNDLKEVLDQTMSRLPETDRDAILLRYFEDKPLKEVAQALRTTEEAARKRVARALERLRQSLINQGIRCSASALGLTLLAKSVEAAPAGLAVAVAHSAWSASTLTVAASMTQHFMNIMLPTKTKIIGSSVAGLVLAGGLTTATLQHASMKEGRGFLEKQTADLADRLALKAKQEADEKVRLRELVAELENQTSDLARLHGIKEDLERQRARLFQPMTAADAEQTLVTNEFGYTTQDLRLMKRVRRGEINLLKEPLSGETEEQYKVEASFFMNFGLAARLFATDNQDRFPEKVEQVYPYLSDTHVEELKQQEDQYLIHFNHQGEIVPQVPLLMWKQPDEKGVNLVTFADGSVRFIRETPGLNQEAYLE